MNWITRPDPNGVGQYYMMHYVQLLIPLINYSVDIEYSISPIESGNETEYAAYVKQKMFDKTNEGLLYKSASVADAMEYCENHSFDITNQMIGDIDKIFKQFQYNVKMYYSKLGSMFPEQKIRSKVRKVMEEYGV